MNKSMRKIASTLLVLIVLISTIVAILGIWDIINLEAVLRKIFTSLIVIFAASAVILFIYSVLFKDDNTPD